MEVVVLKLLTPVLFNNVETFVLAVVCVFVLNGANIGHVLSLKCLFRIRVCCSARTSLPVV